MGERELSGITRELKENIYISTDDTEGHGWMSAGGQRTWMNIDYGFFCWAESASEKRKFIGF